MPDKVIYDSDFYALLAIDVAKSARIVVKLIADLLHPQSVLDVGCGQGEWLRACYETGILDIQGVDGAYVQLTELKISADRFYPHDLQEDLHLGRQFDLAMCLEVGEHLPPEKAPVLVESLVNHSSAIIFSAAVPGQGGVNHVNEQWPWYWKELFLKHNYVQLDPFRRLLWGHPDVLIYYQTNIFLYVDAEIHSSLIQSIGIPDRKSELTLVRTTILQELTDPNLLQRALRKMRKYTIG